MQYNIFSAIVNNLFILLEILNFLTATVSTLLGLLRVVCWGEDPQNQI